MDFIRTYDNYLSLESCQHFIEIAETTKFFCRNKTDIKDKQITLDSTHPGSVERLYNEALVPALHQYVDEFSYLGCTNLVSSAALLQITEPPDGGYHVWHCESTDWRNASRLLAWVVYLNDVDGGGETEFLYQSKKVEPKQGKVVIFPGSFTHLHRGNPTKSIKYLITGWWHGDTGLIKFDVNG